MNEEKPCWKELSENKTSEYDVTLIPADIGVITERVGVRILRNILFKRKDVNRFYPDVKVLCIKKIAGNWNYGVEVGYRLGKEYGKKILLFEIRHGKNVNHKQMHTYSSMVISPEKYFPGVDEVKVFYMVFNGMDTINRKVSYHFCELEQALAKRVLEIKHVDAGIHFPRTSSISDDSNFNIKT